MENGLTLAQLMAKAQQHAGTPLTDEEMEARNKQLVEEKSKQLERERHEARLKSIMGEAAIPERFQSSSFDTYVASNEGQQKALRICLDYANHFAEKRKNGYSLILSGNVGTGKTHLATAVANSVINQGFTAVYTTTITMIRKIRSTWAKGSTKTEDEILAMFAKPDLLVIDEIGAQSGSEDEKLRLFDVINTRYEQMKPTLIITNLPIGERLREAIGDRALDRLRGAGSKAAVFDWESKRKEI